MDEDDRLSATKLKQASIASQPNNGEITIVIPDWNRFSAYVLRLWGQRGYTNSLGYRRDLKADALIGYLQHKQVQTQYETPTLPIPVGATTRTSAPTEKILTFHRFLTLKMSDRHTIYRRIENLLLFPLVLGISKDFIKKKGA